MINRQNIGQLEVLALCVRVHALLASRQMWRNAPAAKGENIFSTKPAIIIVQTTTINLQTTNVLDASQDAWLVRMETTVQLAMEIISLTPLAAPPTNASHLLRVFSRVLLAQHPTSQLNADLVSAHTSSKEMFVSNPATPDIMQTSAMCVSLVPTVAKSALVLLLPAQLAKI